MEESGKPSRNAYLVLLSLFVLVALGFFYSGITRPPTGYLHSWNQVTTLAMARGIYRDGATWKYPQEVVTRLDYGKPTSNSGASKTGAERELVFTVYEEFPLYHLIAAGLHSFGISLETSGRILSVFFFFLGAWGLYLLSVQSFSVTVARVIPLLYLGSFPLLYYGQAIMSDMAMLSCAIWAVLMFCHWQGNKQLKYLLFYLLLLVISSLFKSYSVILLGLLGLELLWDKERRISSYCRAIAVAVLVATPVFSWHLYAAMQPGHTELISHSLAAKLAVLSSGEFYYVLFKTYFRYLGELPGLLLLLFLLALLVKTSLRSLPEEKRPSFPHWLISWSVLVAAYLVLTADKLLDHDYYFLLAAPPAFILTGYALQWCQGKLPGKYQMLFLTVVLASQMAVSSVKLYKAQKVNPDVLSCAKFISENSEPGELIAILTDVSRYNSLAYYSGRRGLTVEGLAFPLSEYRQVGATKLIINLPPGEIPPIDLWLKTQLGLDSKLKTEDYTGELLDFKRRQRICRLISL